MDDGCLIEQVSAFPQLYAKNDPRFKNSRLKENAWESIAVLLEESPEACEHRWKLLRNKYTGLRREIANMPSGSGANEISWPYFKLMGFLDKYLVTRKTFSNIPSNKPKSEAWSSINQIVDSESEQDDSNMSSQLEESEAQCMRTSIINPNKPTVSSKRSIDENIKIPRNTLPTKKTKISDDFTNKISGCFETFSKVMEKNIPEKQTISDDEHFVRSLVADMSVFSQKEKIVMKKKIYEVFVDALDI